MRSGRKALGGSALSQVFSQVGNVAPDVHEVQLLKDFADALEQLHDSGIVMAYHGKLAYYTRISHDPIYSPEAIVRTVCCVL